MVLDVHPNVLDTFKFQVYRKLYFTSQNQINNEK